MAFLRFQSPQTSVVTLRMTDLLKVARPVPVMALFGAPGDVRNYNVYVCPGAGAGAATGPSVDEAAGPFVRLDVNTCFALVACTTGACAHLQTNDGSPQVLLEICAALEQYEQWRLREEVADPALHPPFVKLLANPTTAAARLFYCC